jgi:TetR/AcrR family transcriptional repressor of mexJK operon
MSIKYSDWSFTMSDKREHIMKTAYQLFMDKGFRAVRMSDIAAQAGIAVGTLYQYYSNKQALFDALNMPLTVKDSYIQAEQRKEIVAKALLVFGEYGYEATSMDKIAEACSLSKPTLYQYYSSKEALFMSIFTETDFMKILSTMPLPNSSLPVASVLHQIGLRFVMTLLEPQRLNLMRTALAQTRQFPKMGEIIYEKAITKISEHLTRYLQQLCSEGLLCLPNPSFTARAFLGQLFSFVVLEQLLTNQPNFNAEHVVNQSVNLMLYGILKGESIK